MPHNALQPSDNAARVLSELHTSHLATYPKRWEASQKRPGGIAVHVVRTPTQAASHDAQRVLQTP